MPDRVLIVGAGPTGLTAALELSRLGIAVRIIDKQAAPPDDVPCRRRPGAHAGVARAARIGGRDGTAWQPRPCRQLLWRRQARLSPRLYADRPPLSLPPVHFAGRDRAHPAHGGREAGGPDRTRRRARWAGAGRFVPRSEPGEGRA